MMSYKKHTTSYNDIVYDIVLQNGKNLYFDVRYRTSNVRYRIRYRIRYIHEQMIISSHCNASTHHCPYRPYSTAVSSRQQWPGLCKIGTVRLSDRPRGGLHSWLVRRQCLLTATTALFSGARTPQRQCFWHGLACCEAKNQDLAVGKAQPICLCCGQGIWFLWNRWDGPSKTRTTSYVWHTISYVDIRHCTSCMIHTMSYTIWTYDIVCHFHTIS